MPSSLSSVFWPGRRASSEPANPLSDAEVRQRITDLDHAERRVGYLGAALAAVVGLGSTLPYVLKPSTAVVETAKATSTTEWVTIKGVPVQRTVESCSVPYIYTKSSNDCVAHILHSRGHWIDVLLFMLVFAVAVLVATRIGRRAPLGFVALLTGFAYESQVGLLGIPFIFGGGWLLVRAWRVQRYGTPSARGAMAGAKDGPPRRGQAAKARSSGKSKSEAAVDRRPAPSASKRYTPKAKPKATTGSRTASSRSSAAAPSSRPSPKS